MEKTSNINTYESKEYIGIKTKMTHEVTNIIAASTIAERYFPRRETLPKFLPLPFNNFGHFFLFEHDRYLLIIYQTIMEVRDIAKARSTYTPWLWALLFYAIPCLFLAGSAAPPAFYFIILIIPFVAYYIASSNIIEKMNKDIAILKADTITKLLNDEWVANPAIILPEQLKQSMKASMNGNIGEGEMPVLTVFDSVEDKQPFPGFGKFQFENEFVCPPKKLDDVPEMNDHDFFEAIFSKLGKTLTCCGITNISLSKVIVLNAESIAIDSLWLDDDKRPLLTKRIDYDEVMSHDPDCSVRVYLLVEVLFPKYDSAACFFIRPFKAENSVGWHLALSTIGPPEKRQQYLKDRLHKHRMEINNMGDQTQNSTPPESSYENTLNKIQVTSLNKQKFHENLNTLSILECDFLEQNINAAAIQKRLDRVKENEISWPGRYYFIKYNIREVKSLTFGGDFFGNPELLSSISTIHDQISRKILEAIEEHGYDISKYKDKDGRVSINAGNIGNIVVGEVINMKKEDVNKKSPDAQSNNNTNKT